MQTAFVSFRASDVDPTQLDAIFSTYFEYEQARVVRQLLTQRLLLLLLATAAVTLGVHLLPTVVLVAVGTLSAACLAFCVCSERRAKRRLADKLRSVPPTEATAILQ